MIKICINFGLLFILSFLCSGFCAAMHPPVEIIVDLKNAKVLKTEISCDIPEKNSDFISEIKEKYSKLYSNISEIDSLEIEKIREKYQDLLTKEVEGNVISVVFDFAGFLELFRFDKELLKNNFKKGALPFVVNYNLELRVKQDSPNSSDEIIHKVTFGRFLGGNPIIEESLSNNFVHLQDERNPGQMVLTEKKK